MEGTVIYKNDVIGIISTDNTFYRYLNQNVGKRILKEGDNIIIADDYIEKEIVIEEVKLIDISTEATKPVTKKKGIMNKIKEVLK